MTEPKLIWDFIVDRYREVVTKAHPGVANWPILTGFDCIQARYGSTYVLFLKHTGTDDFQSRSGLTTLSRETIGVDRIEAKNRPLVTARLEDHFCSGPKDMLLVFEGAVNSENRVNLDHSVLDEQLRDALYKHEVALRLVPMKIFLSHKGFDKPKVRDYCETLKLLGFDPWLDEDAMPAGTSLERGILKGFDDSCGAVFFVTPNYVDENFLATEVEYAIAQKRKKGDGFVIVALVFQDGDKKGAVPELLRPYVWKEPKTDLEGLREVIKALPVSLRGVEWRKTRP